MSHTFTRRISEPIQRLAGSQQSPHAKKHKRHVPRSHPHTPLWMYDSDKEHSEACSEPGSGAEHHKFHDSGYNSLQSTPIPSPKARGTYELCENLPSGFSSSSSITVNTIEEESYSSPGSHAVNIAPQIPEASEKENIRDWPEVDVLRRPDPAREANTSNEHTDSNTTRPATLPAHKSRSSLKEGKLKRHLHRFKPWRRSKKADRPQIEINGNDSKNSNTAGFPMMDKSAVSAASLELKQTCPKPTATSDQIARPEREDECSCASPAFPAELPSAIAALNIERTDSQTSTSLDRTPNSSRTLNSLSEGELSFMGVDSTGSTRVDCEDAVDRDTTKYLEKLAGRIVQRCLQESDHCALRQHGSHQSGSSSSSSSSSSTQSTPSETPVTSVSNTPVRSKFTRKDHDDDTDDKRGTRMPKRKRTAGDAPVRLFACPYAKFDPLKYSRENLNEPNYWNCGNCCLRDISRLKQHLYRVHSKPSYYCGSCYQSFRTREELDDHARQRPPCEIGESRFSERMTDKQFQAVKRRVIRGEPYELWFHIFQILFPQAPKPASPYISTADAATINHFVALFRWFGPEEMMNTLATQRPSGHPALELSTQAVVDEAFEIALPDYLRQRRLPQPSRLPIEVQTPLVSEAMDEDVLTMAPLGRATTQDVPSYQPYSVSQRTYTLDTETEMDDSTPRASDRLSGSAFDYPLYQNSQPPNYASWGDAALDPFQIQSAFGSYQPSFDPTSTTGPFVESFLDDLEGYSNRSQTIAGGVSLQWQPDALSEAAKLT